MVIKELHFITGNKNKLAEVQSILGDVVPLKSQSLVLVETQGTIEDISKDKCRRAADEVEGRTRQALHSTDLIPIQVGGPVLTEDTCLCFKALKDLPGPYIKWFLQALGHEGLNNMLLAYPDKSAEAVCWDPIFEYQGETYAEMAKDKKNGLSHRALALAKLKAWLQTQT
ncbi:uncharacterized protein KY384_003646 [Bacidia gigantensis]|uniref:uncharacterized protein n=1 Tax=Bacidia gigantensis TaxID=2732470 RepID=UPI001D04FCF9|nr:uncharacterized protein KY384_003646 [Bacidia gigantensis]KAG8532010.1 hypothetical protein KY384_003646 [Bacidia gigantensis]